MEIVDARGLECPKPVIKTKELVDKGSPELMVYVDNEVAASNVKRFLEMRGYSTLRTGTAPDISISGALTATHDISREKKIVRFASRTKVEDISWSLLLLNDKMGADSDGLGDVLMKAYLGTIQQSAVPPSVIALMNEAVKMALPERSTSEILSELSDMGVPLLICGTCTKHFQITEKIEIGEISNMFEITEAVFGVSKPVVIG
ncbi:sulfurtransferase-like selenium metabolism protein YedF [Synergistaceae bacterium OttesenSCG-928-D05]|nr:sulfurtransferase-like selenium metabolism protein YedF [Synergistaceae bacterium OttesenSCG-928-D05]